MNRTIRVILGTVVGVAGIVAANAAYRAESTHVASDSGITVSQAPNGSVTVTIPSAVPNAPSPSSTPSQDAATLSIPGVDMSDQYNAECLYTAQTEAGSMLTNPDQADAVYGSCKYALPGNAANHDAAFRAIVNAVRNAAAHIPGVDLSDPYNAQCASDAWQQVAATGYRSDPATLRTICGTSDANTAAVSAIVEYVDAHRSVVEHN
jgi:hypothetical protein